MKSPLYLTLTAPVLAMQTEVEAYICRHVLQRVIDGHFYLADHATLICGAVDLEHPSERRVGIGTAAVSELRMTAWNVVIEDYHFHLVFDYL